MSSVLENLPEAGPQILEGEIVEGDGAELVKKDEIKAAEIFSDREKLTVLLGEVEKKVTKGKVDLKTAKGRGVISSKAYSIARLATFFDAIGKELVSERKAALSLIDKERKYAQDELKRIKGTVRKPLDDWEAEQKAEKEKAAAAAKYLADWEEALKDDVIWTSTQVFLKEKAELEKMREDLRVAQERLDRDKELLEERKQTLMDVGAAVVQGAAAGASSAAIQAEPQETSKIASQAPDAAVEPAAPDMDTKAMIHKEILSDLIAKTGMSESYAKTLIVRICKGDIRHLTINYEV